ncbi:MAG: 2-C-methyl-D-erythritol 4-phosphate cytidylyltransferase [Clostridia bacterium]|nr:2-C-methyl-D-erythritol 4-phosphate cytidylyltransferase [Clostridia bacterium]
MKSEKKGRVCGIVLAGGMGSRMGLSVSKQQLTVMGRSILYHALRAFEDCEDIDDVVVVYRKGEEEFAIGECEKFKKVYTSVVGGSCRAESAKRGFAAIPSDTELVAIHDAARALIKPEEISSVVSVAREFGAASAVTPVTDTVKVVDNEGIITATLDRSTLRAAATPQVFSCEIYKKALGMTELTESITDDNMLVELSGVAVRAVEVGRSNIKITTREDIAYAEYLLKGDFR